MNSIKGVNSHADEERIDRRSFLTKSICYTTAGLSLFAYPGILTGAFAAGKGKSKEEIYRELKEKVERFFPVYHSCSHTAFAALNDQFALQADQTVKAIKLFAGGVAGKGETCGAVIGSLLAIGFNFEVINKKSAAGDNSSMMYGGRFFDSFKKEFGSTRCREIIKNQQGKGGNCLEVIEKAVCTAADIIIENS